MPERILTILQTKTHSENKLMAIMDIIHENDKSAYKKIKAYFSDKLDK